MKITFSVYRSAKQQSPKKMDYFEEMGWQPVENTQQHQYLLMIRFMRENGYLPDYFDRDEMAPPASKELVKNLKEKFVKNHTDASSSEDERCAICLKPNTFDDDEDAEESGAQQPGRVFKILPCKHAFHDSCILPWLEKTNCCPLCRFEMKTDSESYEEQKRHKERAKQREEDIDNLHNSMFG